MTSSRSILSHPDFRRLWIADLLSQLGTRLSMIAIPLLAVLPPTTPSPQCSVRAPAAYWSSGSVPR